MISLAFWLVTAAVIIGVAMAVHYFSRERLLAIRWVPTLHGALAALGLVALIIALVGGSASGPDRYGTDSFAPAAAGLAVLAVIAGLTVTLRGHGGRKVSTLIGVHATFAVIAYVLLLGFVWLR